MVPDAVARLLEGTPDVGRLEQAFPLITVDADGFPRVSLLSRAELAADDGTIRAVIGGGTTTANLRRDGTATLLAVDGDTAYSCRLVVVTLHDDGDLLGVVFEAAGHKADTLGIPLTGIGFTPTAALSQLERWDRVSRLLTALNLDHQGRRRAAAGTERPSR